MYMLNIYHGHREDEIDRFLFHRKPTREELRKWMKAQYNWDTYTIKDYLEDYCAWRKMDVVKL